MATSPDTDTICAIATPPGVGGVAIVRVSGPNTRDIAKGSCGRMPAPRTATYTRFLTACGACIDTGIALYFPGPGSFTGEDVLELQGHGGPVVSHMLMSRVMELGARAARPGEFSERAFLNGKLDLAQAEAIADLVSSATEAAARAAQNSLSGVFSRRINRLQEQLTGIRAFVEAAIDFPDEEIDFLQNSDVLALLEETQASVQTLLRQAHQGRLLRDGIVMAIVGRPNAGKSSLLNALSGQDSAIVTGIPGTTRDVLREWIDLDGLPVHVADTAGIRETRDPIEMEGVKRAWLALEAADIVLLVIDVSSELEHQFALLNELSRALPGVSHLLIVFNKIDLCTSVHGFEPGLAEPAKQWRRVSISAKTGEGLDQLKTHIRASLGAAEQTEGGFSARQRHIDSLNRTLEHLVSGEQRLSRDHAHELLAEELRLAQKSLGEITGEMVADDLLGAIFASFCIGK
ncbi:MAG: tRNA uridine-5-carboxymethylaminomethyl(34) synthesis GTPase MnmE [Lysobacterales bacterium]